MHHSYTGGNLAAIVRQKATILGSVIIRLARIRNQLSRDAKQQIVPYFSVEQSFNFLRLTFTEARSIFLVHPPIRDRPASVPCYSTALLLFFSAFQTIWP